MKLFPANSSSIVACLVSALIFAFFCGGENAAAKNLAQSPRTTKQIFELSSNEQQCSSLNVSGVAAYVVSATGTNRGLLLRQVAAGFAASLGMQAGDVLLQINGHVTQTAADAERVMESTEPGPAHIVFVHPGASGLQLYNVPVTIPKFQHYYDKTPIVDQGTSPKGFHEPAGELSISDAAAMPKYESYMVELVNADRQKNGSPPIQVNSALASLAREKADDMAKRGYFSHADPQGVGPMERAQRAGIKVGIFENLAFQSNSLPTRNLVEMCEQSMMNEPPNQQNHRSNILDPNHCCLGIGIARSKRGAVYAVQEFANIAP